MCNKLCKIFELSDKKKLALELILLLKLGNLVWADLQKLFGILSNSDFSMFYITIALMYENLSGV